MYFQYSTFKVFLKEDAYVHLAWSVLSTVSIDKNSNSPSWERNPSATFQALHNSSALFERQGPLSSSSSNPSCLLPTPAVCVPASRAPAVQRSQRERRRGARRERLGWAAKMRPAKVGERLREAHSEYQDSGGKGSCERWSAQRVGAKCVGLARVLSPPPPPSSGRTRFSPPSEGHWYIPADSKSLKRAREAKPSRFGPDLCALRVLCDPRPATLPWGLEEGGLFISWPGILSAVVFERLGVLCV